ncbi:MAG TPA: hypothetical protein VED46_04635 [Alphaproteobacteria bacterium]|nr:hypothetical protein [Alphaproteobacteria bacterium]
MTGSRQQKLGRDRGRSGLIALSLIFMGAWSEDAAGGYPRETVEQFIIACQGDAPLDEEREALCRCAIAVLQSNVPFQRFSDWSRRILAGETVPELRVELGRAEEECKRAR